MADNTGIEWTDATWNPVTGCTKVSPGCDHCYAETLAERFRGTPGHYYERGFDVQLRPDKLDQPLRWRRPRRVFVNSMSDLFHDDVPVEYIARVFAVMLDANRHTFQVLTKRHGRMRALLNSKDFRHAVWEHTQTADPCWPIPNVWLGVSVENQQWADIRIPALLDTPSAVRFLSCEPLLGPVDLTTWIRHTPECDAATEPWCICHLHRRGNGYTVPDGIDWVIVGGESGRGARPMHPDWARSLRDQCQAAGVAFHFKQWGEYAPSQGRIERQTFIWPDGETQDEKASTVAHFPGRFFSDHVPVRPGWVNVERVGKKAAGRELDGRTWDEFPEAVTSDV